jgi:biopolymer transport protein TolQ
MTSILIALSSAQITAPLAMFSGGVWEILANTSFFGWLIISVLVIMSFVSWGIMFNKYRLFKEAESQSFKFENLFDKATDVSDLINQTKNFRLTPHAGIYAAGIKEADSIMEAKNKGGVPDNQRKLSEDDFKTVTMMMDRAIVERTGELERYVVFLATTANAAPFLGLLGTVVGVMDSFWSIGERGSASLTVVAPGIAEALLATIVGLAAAIPAVIGFNWANNKLKYITDRANNFSFAFMARLKKDSYQ